MPVKNPERKPYVNMMLAGFGAISLSVVFFFFLYRLQGVGEMVQKITGILRPFIYGGVIAYLLRPMCNGFAKMFSGWSKGKYPRLIDGLAILASLIVGLLIVYALGVMIAPQLYNSIATLWNSIPDKVNEVFAWATVTFGENEALMNYADSIYQQVYSTLDNWAETILVPQITNIVSGVGMSVWKVLLVLKDILIGIIAAVYLLASRKKFSRQGTMVIRSLFKPKTADLVLDEIAYIDRMFAGFIDGKLVDSAIIGVLCYIGCSIFKFPNPLLISAIIGVTNVIPFFGPFLGAVPATLLILIESPIKALWFMLFVLGLQQFDGNILGPKILGDHTGVDSIWVLFSILLFGGLWGLVGMIIAVPLFAVIYDLIKRAVKRGLWQKGYGDMLTSYDKEFKDDEGTAGQE